MTPCIDLFATIFCYVCKNIKSYLTQQMEKAHDVSM